MMQSELSVGPFSLDISNRRISHAGKRLNLPGRAFDILLVLAKADGEVVSKDHLMDTVWAGRTVEENNIEVHVSALRRALAEHAPGSNLIVTVPGRGYQLLQLGSRADDKTESEPVVRTRDTLGASIAVLPFTNMSGDAEQEYFVDGIVEDIITGLSRIKWLVVIARNSSFVYKGAALDIKRVGRELGVRYVLEGGIRKVGERIRISAQLIDAATGAHIWADKFDRVLDDIFKVQDELTATVVAVIEPSLRQAEIDRVRRARPNSLGAYDLLLRALPYMHQRMMAGANQAIPLLCKALEKEPGYPLAHALLARSYHFRFSRGGLQEEDRRLSVQHARAAIASGSDDATTLATAGLVLWFDDHDLATALHCFDRALATGSSNVVALGNRAFVRAWMGQADAAIHDAQRAIKLSPFDTLNAHLALAVAYFVQGDYGRSCDAARRAVAASPTFSVPHALLAAASVRHGQREAAIAALNTVRELDPSFTTTAWSRTVGVAGETFNRIGTAIRESGVVK
jgi:TolB-like protein/Tfp pilus assembly protein PilF